MLQCKHLGTTLGRGEAKQLGLCQTNHVVEPYGEPSSRQKKQGRAHAGRHTVCWGNA